MGAAASESSGIAGARGIWPSAWRRISQQHVIIKTLPSRVRVVPLSARTVHCLLFGVRRFISSLHRSPFTAVSFRARYAFIFSIRGDRIGCVLDRGVGGDSIIFIWRGGGAINAKAGQPQKNCCPHQTSRSYVCNL